MSVSFSIYGSPGGALLPAPSGVVCAGAAAAPAAPTSAAKWNALSFVGSSTPPWPPCLLLGFRFFLLGFCGSFCGFSWWFASCAFFAARCCRVFWATALTCGNSLVMFPTAFVRPSRNTMRMSVRMYSGFLMNRKRQSALSPVRKCSCDIVNMDAVCLTLPTCTAKSIKDNSS